VNPNTFFFTLGLNNHSTDSILFRDNISKTSGTSVLILILGGFGIATVAKIVTIGRTSITNGTRNHNATLTQLIITFGVLHCFLLVSWILSSSIGLSTKKIHKIFFVILAVGPRILPFWQSKSPRISKIWCIQY